MHVVPVLLAGGIGERFWPMSRAHRPKQLLPLTSDKTILEETLARIAPLCVEGVKPVIVTGRAIATAIRKTLGPGAGCDTIVEPVGRNTAPAVAVAAAFVKKRYGDSVMIVLSADHAISPHEEFLQAVGYAVEIAQRFEKLVVFGIRPTRPDTGLGYLELADELERSPAAFPGQTAYVVRRFVEKPDVETAVTYCASGKHLWNSGMFVWRTSVILDELARYMPDLHGQVTAAAKAGFTRAALDRLYSSCVKESIDYGVMERSERVAAVAGRFLWDDVGSWESIARIRRPNERGTVSVGEHLYERGCADSILVNDSSINVAAFGLSDIVLVVTDDVVLAMPRAELPKIKEHMAAIKQEGRIDGKVF